MNPKSKTYSQTWAVRTNLLMKDWLGSWFATKMFALVKSFITKQKRLILTLFDLKSLYHFQ